MKRVLSLIIMVTSVLIAQPESDVPSNVSFQGLLTDTDGIAYEEGVYQLTFRLIREMNDGTEQTVWEESHSTNVSNGVFSVVLGSENPLPLNISPNVLLETQVGDEILSPRQPLTSVPFALKSSRSQQAYQSVLSDTANFAHNAQLATHADTASFVDLSQLNHDVNVDGIITANYFVGDGSGLTGVPQGGVNSLEDLGINVSSNEINHLDGVDSNIQIQLDNKVEANDLELPISFFSYAETSVTLPTAWTNIHGLEISVNNDMKLHTHAFFSRTGDGAIAAQILLADANGNIIDNGESSARFPSGLASNFVDSDIIFNVPSGSYSIYLFAVGNGEAIAENVFIEVIAFPSSRNNSSNNIILPEQSYPYEQGKPLTNF